MAVRLNITKKGKIIILVSLMVVFAGAGGYLLWRVNSPETISPDISEATGGIGACCGPAGCVAGWKCDTSQSCGETKTVTCSKKGDQVNCGTYKGATGSPSGTCQSKGQSITCSYSIGGKCVKETSSNPDQPTNSGVCNIRACEWPDTLMSSNNCACQVCNGSNGCSGNPPKCTPSACPEGQESCGVSGDSVAGCTKSTSCVAYHPDCNNPTVVYRYCRSASTPSTPETPTITNVCDGGAWVTKPTGVYKYCDTIAYSATATDSDGINESSIVAKLNSTSRTTVTKNTSGTSTTISETLSSSTACLPAGSYTLDLSWADTKGATSALCALTTTFTVQPVETNPDWALTKNVVEICKNENTEDPTSELTYTITLKNIGDGEGTITKIVDIPDAKVLATYISEISNGGTYASGNITWTLTDITFDPQEQRTYTYQVTIPKDSFGKYTNTVTAYPSEGDNVVANAEITADCVIEAPDTGLLDSTWTKILAGSVLIAFGISYNKLVLLSRKLRISVLDMQDEVRKKNFEKKVVKK